jgi:hypothetical protein
MVGFAYGMEFFIAWYGQAYEQFAFLNRATGRTRGRTGS